MNDQTLLHRQVHPNFVENLSVSSQAFLTGQMRAQSSIFAPSSKDENKLSVYNGEKFSPKEAFEHFIGEFNGKGVMSCGVLSVSKSECESVKPLTVLEDNEPFDGHAYIDYSQVGGTKKMKKSAATLRDFAIARGWQHFSEK